MRKSIWLLSAALLFPAPLYAQQADPGQPTQPTGPEGEEEIDQANTAGQGAVADTAVSPQPVDSGNVLVTATRRNQALSDVPLAVSAVSADNLQNSGATDIRQLNQLSPSLLVSSTQSEGLAVARIRGIGTVGDNPGLESSVGVFIDGVYRSRTGMGLTELGPLERIEILRGPQGTLFGRNTSAGLISIITAQPRFESEISGAVTVGNYDLRRLEASATGPITPVLAARLDGVWMKRDGFLEDVISGRDVNDRNRWLLRGQLLFEPSSDLSVRLVADYTRRKEECCAAVYLPAHDFTAAGPQPSTFAGILRGMGASINDDPFERDVAITPGRDFENKVRDWGVSGEVNYDFGGAKLTSITAYRFNNLTRGQDIDYNNLDIFYRPSDGGSGARFKTFSQELRLNGEAFGGKLDWLVGAYLANERLRVIDNVTYGEDLPKYFNCVVGANFASSFINSGVPALAALGSTLVNPLNPTCLDPASAGGLLPFAGANATALAAFARLGAFAGAPFTDSGFANLATALGLPGQSLAGVALDDEWKHKSNNWALFTHNIFEITPGLDLTVGVRYTHEKKSIDASLSDNNTLCTFYSTFVAALQQLPCVFVPSVPGGGPFTFSDSRTENKFSGTAVLSYKPTPELLTYASYSRGYKAGGFNLDRAALWRAFAPTVPPPPFPVGGTGAICTTETQTNCQGRMASGADLQFKPETVDAFEIGAKYNGRGFDLNVAVFHELFENFQLNTFNGLNFVVENINSCKGELDPPDTDTDNSLFTGSCSGGTKAGVRSQGVEIELFTRPMRYLDLNAGVTYADTKYRRRLVGADGRPLTNALFQLPGRRVSNSNEWTLTGAAAWTPPIGNTGLSGLVYADVRHMSGFNTGSDLDLEKFQEAFTVVNARIGIRGRDNAWSLEFWAQNLFDEDTVQVAFDAPVQGSGTQRGVEQGSAAGFYDRSTQLFGAFLGEPRTFGATFRMAFSPPPPAPPLPPPAAPAPVVEAPATQVCADGTTILATDSCPVPPPPPPPPPAAPERG
ncbi:MAG TPA: TonB-dependent receptor [Sphingomicrobium sp.]|nr:TonB-dependent receptor [Sphingomicrobium sp.]